MVRRLAVPTLIFVVWRLTMVALGYAGTFLFPPVARNATAPYTTPTNDPIWIERGLNVWTHWDGEWYLHIATHGYAANNGTAAFYPLYPALVKGVGVLLGSSYVLAAVLVSTLAAWLAFVLLYELAAYEFGTTAAARRIVLFAAVWPGAFFLAAAYGEGLFLATTLGAFLAMRQGRWWWAGAAAMLAVLTRTQGLLLLAPLVWEYARQHGWNWRPLRVVAFRPGRGLAALALPLFGFGGWLAANQIMFGNIAQFSDAQATWKRALTAPWTTVWRATTIFFSGRAPGSFLPKDFGHGGDDPTLLDFGFGLFLLLVMGIGAVAAIVYVWRTWRGERVAAVGFGAVLPGAYLLYAGVSLLLPLVTPAPNVPFLSIIRFGLVIFPVYFLLQRWSERHTWVGLVYGYVAPVLLGLLTVRFVNWYWVA